MSEPDTPQLDAIAEYSAAITREFAELAQQAGLPDWECPAPGATSADAFREYTAPLHATYAKWQAVLAPVVEEALRLAEPVRPHPLTMDDLRSPEGVWPPFEAVVPPRQLARLRWIVAEARAKGHVVRINGTEIEA